MVQRLGKALAATIRNGCIFANRSHLGDNLSGAFCNLIAFKIQIDAAAGYSWQLLRNHSRWTQQYRASRVVNRLFRDLVHAVRDQRYVHVRNILIGQCLGEKERTIETALQRFFESDISAVFYQGP